MKKKQSSKQQVDESSMDECSVDEVIKQLTTKYGGSFSFRGGDSVEVFNKGVVPTGVFTLDRATGIWGLPMERVIEIYGSPGSGKSTLALKTISQAQIIHPETLIGYIDLEHALDLELVKNVGVDIESPNFLISEPESAEEAIDITMDILKQRQRSLITIDSVSSMLPKEEVNKSFADEERMGGHAKLMSRALKHIVSELKGSNSIVVFINQTRQKMKSMGYGPTTTTSGGEALKFYSSVRLSVAKTELINRDASPIGHVVKVKIEKNKVGPPFKEVHADLYYGSGISSLVDLINLAVKSNIVKKGGAWFSFLDCKVQGMYAFVDYFMKDRQQYKLLRDTVFRLYDAPIPHDDAYIDKYIVYGKPDDIRTMEGVVIPASTSVEPDEKYLSFEPRGSDGDIDAD